MTRPIEERVRWIKGQASPDQLKVMLEQRDRLIKQKAALEDQLIEATAELFALRRERDQRASEGSTTKAWDQLTEADREVERTKAREHLLFPGEAEPLDWKTSAPEGSATRAKEAKAQMTVLVVDDNHIVRFLWRKLLEKSGNTVILAENGLDAVKMAQNKLPDLIFMDINLPVLDGYEATRRLREFPATKSTPIIAFSGDDTPEVRANAREAGCDDFVSKKIDLDKLDAILARFTARA